MKKQDKTTLMGYLVGIVSLLITAQWIANAFHPGVVLIPYLIGCYFILISTLWLKAGNLSVEKWLLDSPVRFYIVGFVSCFLLVTFFDLYFIFDIDNDCFPFGDAWDNIIVESHGLLFDMIVLGILLSSYERIKERQKKAEEKELTIKRYLEELDDFLPWGSDEAKFRIRGLIQRLNKEGFSAIELKYVELKGIELPRVQFNGANLLKTNFSGATLTDANFEDATIFSSYFQTENPKVEAKMRGAKFINATVNDCNFEKAVLTNADFTNAKLTNSDFRGADIRGAVFLNTKFDDTKFDGAEVDKNFLENLDGWGIQGQAIHLQYEVVAREIRQYPGKFKYFLKELVQI